MLIACLIILFRENKKKNANKIHWKKWMIWINIKNYVGGPLSFLETVCLLLVAHCSFFRICSFSILWNEMKKFCVLIIEKWMELALVNKLPQPRREQNTFSLFDSFFFANQAFQNPWFILLCSFCVSFPFYFLIWSVWCDIGNRSNRR